MNNRLTATEARTKIQACLESGMVTFRKHAVDRMFERKITTGQVEHVLRAGVVTDPELNDRATEWRHTVTAGKIGVVVAIFDNVAVVTIMRTGR